MSKTISELRASGQVRRTTKTHTICLDVDLSEKYRELRAELFEAVAELERAKEQVTGKPRLGHKPGEGGSTTERAAIAEKRAVVDEKSEQLDALVDQMAEFEIEVTYERSEPAKWNEWAADHPPRENEPDEQGRRSLIIRDAQHGGRVNFDALVDELFTWVTELNGEPVTEDNWKWIAGVASPADLDDLADLVHQLHTGRVSLPKSLKTSLETLIEGFDSGSPATGE